MRGDDAALRSLGVGQRDLGAQRLARFRPTRFSATRICSTKRLASRDCGMRLLPGARGLQRGVARAGLERDFDGALVQRRVVGLARGVEHQRVAGGRLVAARVELAQQQLVEQLGVEARWRQRVGGRGGRGLRPGGLRAARLASDQQAAAQRGRQAGIASSNHNNPSLLLAHMPELPEVEVTRLSFADRIAGARIEAVRLGKPLRWPLGCEPPALVGRTVRGVRRRGKYLLLDLDQGLLLLHLGMSGSLRFDADAAAGRRCTTTSTWSPAAACCG